MLRNGDSFLAADYAKSAAKKLSPFRNILLAKEAACARLVLDV